MNLYALPGLLFTAGYIVLLALVLRYNTRKRVSRVFAVFLLSVIAWASSESLRKLVMPPQTGYGTFWYHDHALFFGRLMALAAALMIATFYHFSVVFPKGRRLDLPGKSIYIIALVWGFIILFRGEFISDVGYSSEGYRIVYGHQLLIWVTIALLVAFSSLALRNFHRSYRNARNLIEREQLRLIFAGSFLTLVLAVLTMTANALDPELRRGIPESFYLFPFTAAVSYAVIRHQLFDVDVLLRDGIISFLTALLMAVLSVALLWGLTAAISSPISTESFLFIMALLTLVILAHRPIEKAVTHLVESLIPNLKWKECKPEEVFLIENGGRVIAHRRGRGKYTSIDRDIVGAMLTTIQDFIKESFRAEDKESLKSLRVGDIKVLVEHSPKAYMAVIFTGYESRELRTDVRRVLDSFDRRFGRHLDGWDGNMARFAGVATIVSRLFPH